MKILSFIKRNTVLCIGILMLFLLLITTFFGEHHPRVDSELKEIKYIWNEEKIPVAPPYEPSEEFLLGTDTLGRDILSLIVMGAKETLLIIVSITLIRYIIAIPFAYFAHKNVFGTRYLLEWLNGFLSYIPTIIIVILLATLPPILITDKRPFYLILIIAVLEVGRVADMVRQEFDGISNKEFIVGGISVGNSSFRMLKSYYLPYLYEKLLVHIVTDLGKVMFLLGQLGFLGIFISQEFVQVDPGIFELRNDSISWPMLLMNAFNDIRGNIWIPFFPALAMTYVIFTFNVLGQGLQRFFKSRITV